MGIRRNQALRWLGVVLFSLVVIAIPLASRVRRSSLSRRDDVREVPKGLNAATGRPATSGEMANRGTAIASASLSALFQSVQDHLTSSKDPDEWLSDLVALETAITTCSMEDLRHLVRAESIKSVTPPHDRLLGILCIACGRAGPLALRDSVAEEVGRAPATGLWGLFAGLSIERPSGLNVEEQRTFWLAAFFGGPLLEDRDYPLRYLSKYGYCTRPDWTTVFMSKGLQAVISCAPFRNSFSMISSNYSSVVLDRLEQPVELNPAALGFIASVLPIESEDFNARASRWVTSKELAPELRLLALESMGNSGLEQTLPIVRALLLGMDENPRFVDGMVSWLRTAVPDSELERILAEAYAQQMAGRSLSPNTRSLSSIIQSSLAATCSF